MKDPQTIANEVFAITAFGAMAFRKHEDAIRMAMDKTIQELYNKGVPVIVISMLVDNAKAAVMSQIDGYSKVRGI
jgi:hypothetical protein